MTSESIEEKCITVGDRFWSLIDHRSQKAIQVLVIEFEKRHKQSHGISLTQNCIELFYFLPALNFLIWCVWDTFMVSCIDTLLSTGLLMMSSVITSGLSVMEAAFCLFILGWQRDETVTEQKHWQAGDLEAKPVALARTFNLTVAQSLVFSSWIVKILVSLMCCLGWIYPKHMSCMK